MIFGYADPPYFGSAKRIYGPLHPEAGNFDDKETHINLIENLFNDYPDGWAYCCNPKDLTWILPWSGTQLRVCAWVKTFHQIRVNCSVQYAWEPVLIKGGRQIPKRKPMVRDWLACARSMRKGLPGAKPDAFNDWVLQLLGFQFGDEIVDLFPGTNGMAKAASKYNTTE